MIDIPPYIEQVIIAKADEQGITVSELLQQALNITEPMLDSGGIANVTLTQQQAQILENLSDKPTPFMQELLAMGNRYV